MCFKVRHIFNYALHERDRIESLEENELVLITKTAFSITLFYITITFIEKAIT